LLNRAIKTPVNIWFKDHHNKIDESIDTGKTTIIMRELIKLKVVTEQD